MKLSLICICLSLLPWLPLVSARGEANKPAAALPPGAAVTVNSRAIPQKIVDSFLKNGREALQLEPDTDEGRAKLAQLRAAIIDEQIDRALIAAEAERRGIAPDRALLDAAEARAVELHGSPAAYDRFLADNGFTREEYREFVLRSNACGEALKAAWAKETPPVSEDEVQRYYEAHKADADFQWSERVTGAHILFKTLPGVLSAQLEASRGLKPGSSEMEAAVAEETERRRERAEAVRRQAATPGADFAALALEYSDDFGTRKSGGSLGTFPRGTHPLALDDALFALKPGEVGPEVVKSEYGFHVIQSLAHLPAGPKTLAEATPEIRRRLSLAAQTRHAQEWLKAARAQATIVQASAR